MDPFVHVFSEIHGWVLQHFTAREFREITTVSPNWNGFIGNSAQMLKYARVEFTEPDEIEKTIRSITRRNRDVSVDFKFDKRSSKLSPFIKYIESVGPTLHDLRIKNTCCVEPSAVDEKLLDRIDLSRLKFLSLHFVTEAMSFKLLSRCNSLTKLKLSYLGKSESHSHPMPFISCIEPFLERNQNLLDLELRGNEIYKVFFEKDISHVVRFNLKRLRVINTLDLTLLPENIERNFFKFLTKQSQSLESLQVNGCRNYVIEHAFNRIPALKSLSINLEFSAESLPLSLNENIVDLSIPRINNLEDFKKIIRVVPRLSKLLSHKLTAAKIDLILRDLPKLEALLFWDSETAAHKPVWKTLWPHAIRNNIEFPGTQYQGWIIKNKTFK